MTGIQSTEVLRQWDVVTKMPEGTKGRTSKTVQAMKDFLATLPEGGEPLSAQQLMAMRHSVETLRARVVRHARGTGLFKVFFGALMGWRASSKFSEVFSELETRKKARDKCLVEKCKKEDVTQTLFQQAIDEDNAEAFMALVGRRGDRFSNEDTVKEDLESAALCGSLGIVKTILKEYHGGVQQFGEALCEAANNGHVEVVRAFLNAGVPANSKKGTETALTIAVAGGDDEVVHVLLEAGASIEKLKQAEQLWVGVLTGRLKVVTEVLQKPNPPVNVFSSLREDRALHLAVRGGDIEIVKALLACDGIKVNKKNKDKETALHVAVRKGDTAIVKALLAKNPDVNKMNKDGFTALHLAARGGHVEIVEALLTAGAQRESVVDGKTPLQMAQEKGYQPIIDLLKPAVPPQ